MNGFQLGLIIRDRQLFLQRIQLLLQLYGIDRLQLLKGEHGQKLCDLDLCIILIDMIDAPFFFN